MEVAASTVIDRPPSVVFQFVAIEHLQNHPRWDEGITLEPLFEGPIQLGSRLRRISTRTGTAIEGTMEVVEFEPDRSFRMLIHDGPVEMRGHILLEPEGDRSTKLTMTVEIPGAPNPLDPLPAQTSVDRTKQFIEAEH